VQGIERRERDYRTVSNSRNPTDKSKRVIFVGNDQARNDGQLEKVCFILFRRVPVFQHHSLNSNLKWKDRGRRVCRVTPCGMEGGNRETGRIMCDDGAAINVD